MKIVLLGEPAGSLSFPGMSSAQFFRATNPAHLDSVLSEHRIDSLISYGYRYILPPSQLKLLVGLAVNLHIGYLPFNKGAHPNLWSNLENTPSGVTIHVIEPKVDEGPIILQEEVFIDETSTFRESYKKLSNSIEQLFLRNCKPLLSNELSPVKQISQGSLHRKKDFKSIEPILKDGWDTIIRDAKCEYLKFLELNGYRELCCVHQNQ